VVAVVSVSDANTLLDKLETIDHLAQESDAVVRDLRGLQQMTADARDTLLKVEQQQRAIEAQMRAQFQKADKLLEDRVKAENALRGWDPNAAAALANANGNDDAHGVISNQGGRCSLPGIPAAAREIIRRESNFNPYARNPASTAMGLGQLLVGNRIRLMGDDYNSYDCAKQYAAFKAYTVSRYGTFENAWAFWQAHHYY
jgi:ABC-type transporter Mla subunit MlaD